ncbi:glycosyltransferase, putative, partial [Ricinus communis]
MDLALALRSRKHHVAIMCGLAPKGMVWLKNRITSRVMGNAFPMDSYMGFPVYRGWNFYQGFSAIAEKENPDCVIVQGALYETYEFASWASQAGHRIFFYIHDLSVPLSDRELPDLTRVTFIANSPFTAATIKSRLGLEIPVVPPLILQKAYRVQLTPRYVTMINPRPGKGADIALAIASACPDIRFSFVEAWGKLEPASLAIKKQAQALPNVQWLRSQLDMRKIYSQTRVLLAPSRYKETWGRVITEAQFSGIPTIASDQGAFPETVGPGGIIVPINASTDEWIAALRRLWDCDSDYQ